MLQLDFDDFLGVVPGAAGVGHEDGLVQAEDGDREQVADEEERLDEGEGERGEEDGDEDVEHALLRVLGADFDDLLAVGDAGGGCAVELDVGLDEFDRAVGAGGDGLRGGAGEPVDHGAAGDQAEDERRVEERELVDVFGEAVGQGHDDREDHRGGADDRGADQHGLGGGFEGVAGAVVGFEHFLGALEVHVDVVVLLQLGS